MEKICPCCKGAFGCQNDQIGECWCLYEPINSSFRKFLEVNFSDCLCNKCITVLRRNYINYEQLFNTGNEKN